VVKPTDKGRREKMSKTMSQAIRGHYLRRTMVIAALAVMLLALTLVVVVETTLTTSDRGDANLANPAMSANGGAGSSVTYDPYIERHAEVVQRLGGGSLR
jgi:hypothetical protein